MAALFASLGFNTDARLAQTPANLGITTESLVRSIVRLERLADQEGLLQVYLVELTSVTVTATRGLATALRNRAGNYLLVLTHDYERIDFVLVEKKVPRSDTGHSIGQRQVSVRPRVLTVERRNPNRVCLRVLRRVTYTEPDPIAQYDKLCSAFDIADWSEEHFNNRALFSDHYLRQRLPELPPWKDDPKPVFRQLRAFYERAASRWADKREEELRRGLLEPALTALGFHVETMKAATDDRREPDYHLHTTAGGPLLAVCLAYRWGRLLDSKDEQRDTDTPEENPGGAVVSLLERGEAPFAIVTNGKHWRLYATKTHSRATNYYEIDLEETLALDDPAEAFRYFWLVFRAAALEPCATVVEGERRSRSFAEQLLDDSQSYAKQLGERLKDRIFDEVFLHLAEGFLAHRGTSAPPAQAELDAVFQGTLTLLYRVLFLLYAEARDLLPVKEIRGYYESSLTKVKLEVAGKAGDVSAGAGERLRKAYGSDSRALYDRLAALFRLVDRGDASRNVPVYDGGLFLTEPEPEDDTPEADNARFLLANAIPDRHLARGIDLLARDDDDKSFARVFIDYKSLGVRQLGSIYEGLLEFRLRLAPEKMAICRGKKTEEVVPYREAVEQKRKILLAGKSKSAVERTLPRGAVYLENDRRERKASGSYYTPDFVVEYIVTQTVGPVLDERFERVRPRLREAQKALRREREKASALRQRIGTADDPEREAFLKYRDVVDALFDVTVLDPAMGSGHFLVEAVDYITDRLLDFLNGFPWNPVVQQLDDTRQSILRELDAQGVTIDAAKLTDVNLLKRHVLKRCIYGVDLNPMAVELAKVSLWLDSFTLGAPLSFLDHHLKCGNSLLGVGVEEVRHAIEGKGLAADAHDTRSQGSLFGSRFAGLMLATDLMRHVGELSDVTAAQVQQSRNEFRRASDELVPFKRILDLYSAQWLIDDAAAAPRRGRAAAEPAVVALLKSAGVEALIGRADRRLSDDARRLGEDALAMARERRVFHWELEFPEIFYSGGAAASHAGFDAVVGNPPWIRQETIQSDKPALRALFANVFDSVADLYVFFLARAFSVLAPDGRLGMIVPNKWQRAAYGEKLRRLLAEDERPVTVVDFGHAPIFPDADTFPCILIARHAAAPADAQIEVCSVPREALPAIDLPAVIRGTARRVPAARLGADTWDLEDNAVSELLAKIRRAGVPLREYIGGRAYRGVLTGLNEAFLIDQATRDRLVAEDPQCEPIIKKFLRGSDIQRWHPQWGGEWMIFARRGIDITRYPSINCHLAKFRRELEPRPKDWVEKRDGKWPGRKPGAYEWYEIQDTIDYFPLLDSPKIVYQDIAFHSAFAFDDESLYANNTCYFVPREDPVLLAILNSSVTWWYLTRSVTHGKDEALRLFGIFMEELPIPKATPRVQKAMEDRVRRVIALSRGRATLAADYLGFLKRASGLKKATERLASYHLLTADELADELRRGGASKLAPIAKQEIVREHSRQIGQLIPALTEVRALEIELQQLVFELYGLTPDEVHLLRSTAPPRDPLALVESAGAKAVAGAGIDGASSAGGVP